MMKRSLIVAVCALWSFAYGQQMPQFSQYLRNQYMVNPGAAGMYDFIDITMGGRMQWVNFTNAPVSSYIYGASTLSKKDRPKYNPALRISQMPVRNPEVGTGKLKHAIGGMMLYDQYGAFQRIKGALTYALHLPVSDQYNLSFGVNLGMTNHSFDKTRAQTLDVMDPSLGYTDPVYADYINHSSTNTMDIGAGLYFYSKNLFVGVATEQLTKDFVEFGKNLGNFEPKMHFSVTAGYKFPIGRELTLMPAILAKYMSPSPVSIEGSLQLEYAEWLWFTASYRQGIGGFNNADAVVVMAGCNISERFKIGYSYDITLSRVRNYSAGGHELVLGVMLGR